MHPARGLAALFCLFALNSVASLAMAGSDPSEDGARPAREALRRTAISRLAAARAVDQARSSLEKARGEREPGLQAELAAAVTPALRASPNRQEAFEATLTVALMQEREALVAHAARLLAGSPAAFEAGTADFEATLARFVTDTGSADVEAALASVMRTSASDSEDRMRAQAQALQERLESEALLARQLRLLRARLADAAFPGEFRYQGSDGNEKQAVLRSAEEARSLLTRLESRHAEAKSSVAPQQDALRAALDEQGRVLELLSRILQRIHDRLEDVVRSLL